MAGARNAIAIFNALIVRSRFMLLVTAQPITRRKCRSRITAGYSRIQPALARPDIGNVSCPFLVWLIRCEITIRQVWRNVELVIAVCRHLVFASSNHGYAVVAHQTPNTAVPDIKANLFEFFSHTRPAIAAKAETGLFFDMANVTTSERCLQRAER